MKTKHNFKVGDKVRIRQWDDMEKEFKKDSVGNLKTITTYFTTDMKHLCGRSAEIKNINSRGEVILHNWSDDSGRTAWCFDIDMIEPIEPEQITITRYGQKVVAKLGEKVGVAKCNPKDEFDFNVGAKLAFARLMGEEKTENSETAEYKEVDRPVKVGDYIKLTNKGYSFNEVGDILKVHFVYDSGAVLVKECDHPKSSGHGVSSNYTWIYNRKLFVVVEKVDKKVKEEPKKEEFKPHLKADWSDSHYGNIGEETNQTDVFEERLCVGDVVELYNVEFKKLIGERAVIYTDGEYGVMGVCGENFKNGISNEWRIKKVKSYKDLTHNEKVDSIIAILKEE